MIKLTQSMLLNKLIHRLIVLPVFVIVGLVSLGSSCGDKSTQSDPLPTISLVSTTNTDIMPGDIVTIIFATTDADSVLSYPGAVEIVLDGTDTTTLPVQLFTPTELMIIASNAEGSDTLLINITMSAASPNIVTFEVDKPVIVNGDSTLLTWNIESADSVLVNNGFGKLPSDSGQIYLKPNQTTTYRAVAYFITNDTAYAPITVETPVSIESIDSIFTKGNMGSNITTPALGFIARTTANEVATQVWINMEVIAGDGTLSHDSMLSNTAAPTYDFSGSLGHATIRAYVRDVDTVEVNIRANTLILGPGGQGQYILFDDNYAWVETYNGPPEAVGVDPVYSNLLYIDYESTLGVVIMGIDIIGNGQMDPMDSILGVIVNDQGNGGVGYDKKTPEGIGIGSTFTALTAAYGLPDTTFLDPEPPAADVYIYDSLGLSVFAAPADSVIFEMHLIDPTPAVPLGAKAVAGSRYLPRRYTK